MVVRLVAGFSIILFSSVPLIARDGTLPVILDGMVVPLHNSQAVNLKAQVKFNDLVTPPDINVPCSLSGDSITSDTAAGQVLIGNETFKIIGTCKDEDSDAYEIVAKKNSETTNFVGQVSSSQEQVKFEGIVNMMTNNVNKKLKFELKK